MRIGPFDIVKRRELAEVSSPIEGEKGFAAISTMRYGKRGGRYNPDDLIGRKGWKIYQRIARDEQVKALTMFLRFATVARGFHWQVNTGAADVTNQHRYIEFVKAMLDNALKGIWLDRLLDIQTCHDFGFALMEKIYDTTWEYEGKAWWALRDMKLRPFQTFVFDSDDHGNLKCIVQETEKGDRPQDAERYIHLVNKPSVDPQYGESDFREIYRAFWSKENLWKFRNIFLERVGSGVAVFRQTGTLTKEDKAYLDDILTNLQAATGIRIPKGVEFEIVFPEGTDSFDKAIASCDTAIAKGLLVPNLLGLSEQGQTGSYAQSQTQMEAFLMTLDARAQRVAESFQEGLFSEIAEWNMGLRNPPRYTPLPWSPEQKAVIIDTWTKAVVGGSVVHDLGSEQFVRELLGFPARDEDEEPAPKEPRPPEVPAKESPGGESTSKKAKYEEGEESELQPWERRVDYVTLDEVSRDLEGSVTVRLGETMLDVGESLRRAAVRVHEGDADLAQVQISKGMKGEIQKILLRGMTQMWKLGERQAARELPKAGRDRVAWLYADAVAVPPAGMDDLKAHQYLIDSSFRATGNLTDDVLSEFNNVLLNGAKYDQDIGEIIANLDEAIGQYLPTVDSAGRVVNPAARLATIARNNLFDAMNEARYAFFREPDLQDFVVGLQYSSIMDSRTTEICDKLHGFKAAADDPVWQGIRPPNHHNCRATIIAITSEDRWKPTDDAPPIMPAEGWGATRTQAPPAST